MENITNGSKRNLGTGSLSTQRVCEGSTGKRKENTGSLNGHFFKHSETKGNADQSGPAGNTVKSGRNSSTKGR